MPEYMGGRRAPRNKARLERAGTQGGGRALVSLELERRLI
jgi:hypothetical protein